MIPYKTPISTHQEIPDLRKVQTPSDYELATLGLDEGVNTSEYEHLSKSKKFRPWGYLYVPRKAKFREPDYTGGLICYDYDNSKRKFYKLQDWLNNNLHNSRDKRDIPAIISYTLPRMIKGEVMEYCAWVFPYFFYRI